MLKRLFKDLFKISGAVDAQPAERADAQRGSEAMPALAAPAARIDDTTPDLWRRLHTPLSDLTIIVPILPGRGTFLETP